MAGSSPVNGSEQPKYLDINRSIQPVDWRKQSLNRCQQPEHLHLDYGLQPVDWRKQSLDGCQQFVHRRKGNTP